MKRLIKTFLYLFVAFLIITTFTPVRLLLPSTFPHGYCANQCDFRALERAKGVRDPFLPIMLSFEEYKREKGTPDLVLYRSFSLKWWHVWNWFEYLCHPRWRLPYAERDEDKYHYK